MGTVYTIDFSEQGNLFVAGDDSGAFRIWDTLTWDLLYEMKYQEDGVLTARFNPAGDMLVTGCGGGGTGHTIKCWDARKGTQMNSFDEHRAGVYDTDFSLDQRFLASCSADNRIIVRSYPEGQIYHQFAEHKKGLRTRIFCVRFSPLGKYVVSGAGDRSLRLWSMDEEPNILIDEFGDEVRTLCFSDNGEYLFAGSQDGVIKAWDWIDLISEGITLESLRIDVGDRRNGRRVCAIDYHPGGYIAAGTADDGIVWVWSLESKQVVFKQRAHWSFIWSVKFSKDGKFLASCGEEDGKIYIWEFPSGNLLECIEFEDRD